MAGKFRDFDDDYNNYDDYEEVARPRTTQRRPAKKRKRKMRTGVKVAIFSIEVILLLCVILVWYVVDKLSIPDYYKIDPSQIVTNADIHDNNEKLEGFTNILLLGSDSRQNTAESLTEKGKNNTDTIIICSINNETKEVKLASIYRDTLLLVPHGDNSSSYKYNKANSASMDFGIESTIGMVNMNLDLDISDFVMVNWEALIQIVDAVGGVDITIDDNELYWLNEYLRDTGKNTGRTYDTVKSTGLVHLDGIQATAYCRIRYGGGSDYRRTERQRTVLQQVFTNAQDMNLIELNSAINSVLSCVATSLEPTDILSMAKDIMSYKLVDQTGFPTAIEDQITEYPSTLPDIKNPVIPKDLAGDVSALHLWLFGKENYKVSDKVNQIAQEIRDLTGLKK